MAPALRLFVMVMVTAMFSLFSRPAQAVQPADAYGFSFKTIDGADLPLSAFKGKAVLVVNTASECGFTPQYEGLEKLYLTYKDKGLVVLGVPSNDFGGQEPGTAAEIKHFCENKYDVTFPLAEKEVVSGAKAHPFYAWAAAQKKGGLIFSKPRWNFHKYLLDTNGKLVGSYASTTKPLDADLIAAIEAVLPKQ